MTIFADAKLAHINAWWHKVHGVLDGPSRVVAALAIVAVAISTPDIARQTTRSS